MARICIIAPGQLGSTPRVVKEAQALSAAGHSVTVIAIKMLELVEPRDQDILASATWRTKRLPFEPSLQWKLRRLRQAAAKGAYGVLGGLTLASYGWNAMTPGLTRAALATPADLYIAHYPAALPAAVRAAERFGALYAFDAEDFHPGEIAADKPLERRLLESIERTLLSGCAYVSAASPGIADKYAEVYGIPRPLVLLNVFPLSQAPAGSTDRGSAQPGPSLYWFSQVVGANRGLETVVRALGLMKTCPHLYLRGLIRPDARAMFEGLARESRVADRIHFLEPEAPSEMERLAAVYDLGLSSEVGHTESRKVALGNKVFSFLLAGLPVVASDLPAHRALASELQGAMHLFAVADPAWLAQAVDDLLSSPARLHAARSTAWRLGQERYNWDVEQQTLVEAVAAVLGGARRQSTVLSTTVSATI